MTHPPRHTGWAKGDPIVVFGDDWGRYVSTMQHLFRHIARDYPVIWINAIGHRPPSLSLADLRRAIEKIGAAIRKPRREGGSGLSGGASPRIIIEPRVLPWHQVAIVHRLNTLILTRSIRRALRSLRSDRPPVLVTGSPPSVGVVGKLGEAASVYLCMDDFLNFPGVSAKMIGPLERRLLAHVDAVVATAKSLTVSKFPASGVAHHLPQGVNYEHFSTPRPEPLEMRNIPRPRIGFAGTVGGCCDLELIRRVAERYRECSVVLVGPISATTDAMSRLRLPNVHVLGLKPYSDLPAYVQHFDVGIIPYTLSAWTVAVDPLKLLEYLAAGLPVVSTDIPEAHKYSPEVTVADGDAFIHAIGAALAQDARATRARSQSLASQHSWERRADRLLAIIGEAVAARASGRAPRLTGAAP